MNLFLYTYGFQIHCRTDMPENKWKASKYCCEHPTRSVNTLLFCRFSLNQELTHGPINCAWNLFLKNKPCVQAGAHCFTCHTRHQDEVKSVDNHGVEENAKQASPNGGHRAGCPNMSVHELPEQSEVLGPCIRRSESGRSEWFLLLLQLMVCFFHFSEVFCLHIV